MTGKAFELVERTRRIKGLGVKLQRAQCSEAARAADRGLFQCGSVRRARSGIGFSDISLPTSSTPPQQTPGSVLLAPGQGFATTQGGEYGVAKR